MDEKTEQQDEEIEVTEQEESDKLLLKRLAEKDKEIAQLKKTTVPKDKYNELVADIADGKYNPEEPEEEEEEEQNLTDMVKGLLDIGTRSIRKRVGNREAIRRQVETARRIKHETGDNPLIASGTPIDSESKAERWLNIMEEALEKSTDDATFQAYFNKRIADRPTSRKR